MGELSEIVFSIHISLAIIVVITGTAAVISRKSQQAHIAFGKMYVVSNLVIAVSAFILMLFPEYRDSIMFLFGIYNVSFTISGYRSLKLKLVFSMDRVSFWDKFISTILFFISTAMFYHGIFSILDNDVWGYVLFIYSILGFMSVYNDVKLYNTKQFGAFTWMEFHASKMIMSYTGAFTMVFVTQFEEYLGILTWFIPCTFGIIYMFYWIKKIRTSPESVFDF